jgi:hypothetical protein
MKILLIVAVFLLFNLGSAHTTAGDQPLSKIAISKAVIHLHDAAAIQAYPNILGLNGADTEWVQVELQFSKPSNDDWVGVFSPGKINASSCYEENNRKEQPPYICSAPIKYKFANHGNPSYLETGRASLKFQMINQRSDFSFGLFSGGLSNPKLLAVSNTIQFAHPNAPVYPRLAQGKSWNEVSSS